MKNRKGIRAPKNQPLKHPKVHIPRTVQVGSMTGPLTWEQQATLNADGEKYGFVVKYVRGYALSFRKV